MYFGRLAQHLFACLFFNILKLKNQKKLHLKNLDFEKKKRKEKKFGFWLLLENQKSWHYKALIATLGQLFLT